MRKARRLRSPRPGRTPTAQIGSWNDDTDWNTSTIPRQCDELFRGEFPPVQNVCAISPPSGPMKAIPTMSPLRFVAAAVFALAAAVPPAFAQAPKVEQPH